MRDPEFTTSVSEKEVVVVHVRHGHVFKFPILSNGTVTLNGYISTEIHRPQQRPDDFYLKPMPQRESP